MENIILSDHLLLTFSYLLPSFQTNFLVKIIIKSQSLKMHLLNIKGGTTYSPWSKEVKSLLQKVLHLRINSTTKRKTTNFLA